MVWAILPGCNFEKQVGISVRVKKCVHFIAFARDSENTSRFLL